MKVVTGPPRAVGEARIPTEVLTALPEREEYDGVSCRPMAVAPGPRDASRILRLRCRLDTLSDRTERRVRWFAIRGLGLSDKIASRVGMGGFYRHIPVLCDWRTPTPIVAPIFIIGPPRSGTTILGKVLGHQGEVLYFNEARPLWYRVMPEVDERKYHWANSQLWGRYYLDESDFSPEAQASLERDFGWALRFSGRDRLIEKLPINLFRVRWLCTMWPDALFIHIMRDPFSTTASKTACWPSIDEQKHPGKAIRRQTYAKLFPELAEQLRTVKTAYEWYLYEWRIETQEGERLREMYPGAYLFVQLEEVQRNPEEMLARICDFAGLRFTSRLRRAYQTMLDRQIRMGKPEVDRRRCAEILGNSAERWGYRL